MYNRWIQNDAILFCTIVPIYNFKESTLLFTYFYVLNITIACDQEWTLWKMPFCQEKNYHICKAKHYWYAKQNLITNVCSIYYLYYSMYQCTHVLCWSQISLGLNVNTNQYCLNSDCVSLYRGGRHWNVIVHFLNSTFHSMT